MELPDDYEKTPDGEYVEKWTRHYEKPVEKPLDWDKLFNSVARELARQADSQREELNKKVIANFNLHVAEAEGRIVKQRVEALLYDIMGPRSREVPNPSERGG